MIGPWALEVPIFEPIDYQKILRYRYWEDMGRIETHGTRYGEIGCNFGH